MAKSKSEGIDWGHWANLRKVRVYEALALLDGQEPPEDCPDADDESPAYRKRMRLLLDALSNREWFGPLTLNISEPLLHGLNLAELGRWARANGYTLPDEFPCAAAQAGAVQASAITRSVIPWKLWASVPHVQLWQAVALVLNIEPSSLKRSGLAWMAGPGRGPIFEPHSFPSATSRDDFNTALEFAERAANVTGPIHLNTGLAVGMNKREAQVSLREVVAYFIAGDWPGIPLQLVDLLPPSTTAKAGEQPPDALPPIAATRPEPLTTGHIANCFNGLGWDEKGWKKPLADKPKWLQSCVEVEGRRGVRETEWNPVCIGAALHRQKGIAIRTVRARFQAHHLLKPWLELWQDYEAENFDPE